MISIVLYGRNDSHGYNFHRRAALSLNCLAEVLTDDDDEIVYVDYNTPDELPTFIEALADTLTDRCLSRLRVLRVPPALHHERFKGRTHLPLVEPVCRNAAVRRTNPRNRWLLSTNTDMILLPHQGNSLSEICSDLPDGFYGLPKYELPEWVWENLPRSDPERAMAEVRSLGPRLRLDEPTLNNEWVLFDAPGDFQLCLREDFIAIDGFDEQMLLGWHVDSNFSRRLVLHRGSIQSADDQVSGYHCNHNRTPTLLHASTRTENDLGRFFSAVKQSELPSQRRTWGLADVTLEESRPKGHHPHPLTNALLSALPADDGVRTPSDVREGSVALIYDSGHVLPHVVDSIAVSSPHTTIAHVGANPVLHGMISQVVNDLGDDFSFELVSVSVSDASDVEEVARSADVYIVDLGLDLTLAPEAANSDIDCPPGLTPVPESLRTVVIAFDRLVRKERRRLEQGHHPRRFVLVNSATAYFDSFVTSNLDCSHTSIHSRVRRATVKLVPSSDIDPLRYLRWSDRLKATPRALELRLGKSAEFGDLEDFRGFGPGWWVPDPSGVWTRGPRAVLVLACEGAASWTRPVLELRFDRVGVRPGRPVRIGLLIGGTLVARRLLTGGTGVATWHARVPQHAIAKRQFEVVFEIEGDEVWSDKNQLGLHVRSLRVDPGFVPIRLRTWIDSADAAAARIAGRTGPWVRRARGLARVRRPRADTSSL